jgi:hypothetical protein
MDNFNKMQSGKQTILWNVREEFTKANHGSQHPTREISEASISVLIHT